MIQPETLQAVELRDHLADVLLKKRRGLNVRLSDPQTFPMVRQRNVLDSLPNRRQCGRRRFKDFEIARRRSLFLQCMYQLEQIGRIDVD